MAAWKATPWEREGEGETVLGKERGKAERKRREERSDEERRRKRKREREGMMSECYIAKRPREGKGRRERRKERKIQLKGVSKDGTNMCVCVCVECTTLGNATPSSPLCCCGAVVAATRTEVA